MKNLGDRLISVLLVDDQPFVAAALGRLLSTEPDLELHCCHDAREAIGRANQIRPALILQDLVMPDIDGLTVVQLFRNNAATAATPIIVLSGNDDAATRERALAAGASDYLVKLPAKDTLVASIRRHASGQRAVADSRHGDDPILREALDPLALDAFREPSDAGLPEFALSLIEQFIDEASARINALVDAGRARDTEALKAAAHSLKGSSLVIGAKRLASLCVQLEHDLENNPDAAIARVSTAAFSDELAHVRRAYADLRKETV